MANCYLAQQAGINSLTYASSGRKREWLDLFADDAVVQDPVGVSPLDPSGLGHRGKQAIEAFWDAVMPNGIAGYEIHESHPAGDSCANVQSLFNRLPDGTMVSARCVAVYTVNDAGKLVSLRAYWDYNKLNDELQKLVGG
ncbi:MAG: hypothetical protein CALGDGBN_01681 [Pseudomonadales bacterium]|nr:hypothetical protein [Pseudomonadales bacterium]